MPDTIATPKIPNEPLWSRRLNAARQKNDRFFREARQKSGRVIAYEALVNEKENIDTAKDGRTRPLTAEARDAGQDLKMAQGRYQKTKTVGSGAAQRTGAAQVNSRAFDRMKAEAAVEKMRTGK